MSGGSYEYFYDRAPDKLRNIASDLAHMADRCDERALGPPEIDYETKQPIDMAPLAEVAKYLRVMSLKVSRQAVVLETWKEVLRNIEWWASHDNGPEDVLRSFDELPRLPAMKPEQIAPSDARACNGDAPHHAQHDSSIDGFYTCGCKKP